MSARHEVVTDAAMLAVIGTVVVVVGDGRGCGADWPARCSAPAGPTWASAQLLGVLVRLPSRLGDPAGAWPSPARPLLPGAGGFYAALAMLAGAGGALALAAGRVGAGLRSGAGARWASTGELRRLRQVRRTWSRRPARPGPPRRPAPVRRAPPRARRLRPAAVGQIGRHRHTRAARLEWPRGRLLDQDRPAGRDASPAAERSARCSCSIRSGWPRPPPTPGRRCAVRRPGTARSRSRGGWPRRPRSTAAASRAATSGRSPPSSASPRCCTPRRPAGSGMDSVVRWVTARATRELDEMLMRISGEADGGRAGGRRVRAAYDAVRAFEAQADRTRTSIEATAQTLLRAYRFQRVLRSAASSDISADRLLDGAPPST